MEAKKYYNDVTARHYDPAYEADPRLQDMEFYTALAKAASGPVLEVACGTGRILLPCARAGVEIDGLDYSDYLLATLKAKLKKEAAEVQSRVRLFPGDMRSFQLDRTYALLMLPFRPLQHLLSVDDQLRAFHCFANHLEAGGKLAFNVFYPNHKMLEVIGEEFMDLSCADPQDPSLTVKRYFVRKVHHRLEQFFEAEFIYRSYREEGLVLEERSGLTMSYYTYPQIRLLLEHSGFKVLEEFGSYAKEPISICNEMIFVASKK